MNGDVRVLIESSEVVNWFALHVHLLFFYTKVTRTENFADVALKWHPSNRKKRTNRII